MEILVVVWLDFKGKRSLNSSMEHLGDFELKTNHKKNIVVPNDIQVEHKPFSVLLGICFKNDLEEKRKEGGRQESKWFGIESCFRE